MDCPQRLERFRDDAAAFLRSRPRTCHLADGLPADLQSPLRVAVVGPHNAGKSTLISALTGNRNIARTAEPETSTATAYHWHDLQLLDMPGWFSGFAEHDEAASAALRQLADAIAFVLTPEMGGDDLLARLDEVLTGLQFADRALLVVNRANTEDHDRALVQGEIRRRLGQHGDLPLHWTDAQDFLHAEDFGGLTDEEREVLRADSGLHGLQSALLHLREEAPRLRMVAVVREVLRVLSEAERCWDDQPHEAALREVVALRRDSLDQARARAREVVAKQAEGLEAALIGRAQPFVDAAVHGDDASDAAAAVDADWEETWDAAHDEVSRYVEKELAGLDDFAGTLLRSDLVAEALTLQSLAEQQAQRRQEGDGGPGLLDAVPAELLDRARQEVVRALRDFRKSGSGKESAAYEWARRLQPNKKFKPYGRLKDAERLRGGAKAGEKLLGALPVILEVGGVVGDVLDARARDRQLQERRESVRAYVASAAEERRREFERLSLQWLNVELAPLYEAVDELGAPLAALAEEQRAWLAECQPLRAEGERVLAESSVASPASAA